MLQNYLYKGEKEIGGCVGTIKQSRINRRLQWDKFAKYKELTLKYHFEKLGDLEKAFIYVNKYIKFKQFFIPELFTETFNKKNKKRINEIQKEILENNLSSPTKLKGFSDKNTQISFWIFRGYSEEESIQKVIEVQKKNSLKYKEKRKLNPEKYLDIQPNQLGYWIKKGYSEEDAKKRLSERQTTFSLQICIDKYGIEEGTKIFNKRQEKWQESMDYKKIRKIKEEMGLVIKFEDMPHFKLYKKLVQIITEKQNLKSLKNIEKRGLAKKVKNDTYNVDHKISIKYGFDNGILPHIIGNIENLQLLKWQENYSKGTKCYSKLKENNEKIKNNI